MFFTFIGVLVRALTGQFHDLLKTLVLRIESSVILSKDNQKL